MGDSALSTVTQIGFTLAGFAIAGPFGAFVGSILGAFVANELFGQDIETSRGRIADLKVATSEYGFPIAHIWGCMRVGGSAYFNSDLIEKKHTESSSVGGKGGGTTVKSTTFYYSIDIGYKMALSPANFPAVSVPFGWGNGKLLWDFTNEDGPIFESKYVGDTGGPFNQGTIRIRLGAEDQLPDPTYEKYGGVGTTPADRGYVTIILDDFPLEDFGNSPLQLNAVVCTSATALFPWASMPEWTINTQSIRFAPDGRTLFPQGATSVAPELVNSDTREFIKAPGEVTLQPLVGTGVNNGNAPIGFHDIDAAGRGLSHDANISDVVTPFLHDINSYAVIARGGNGSSGIVESGATHRFFGSGSRIFIFGNSGQRYTIYGAGSFIATTQGEAGSSFTGFLIPKIVSGLWADHSLSTFPEFGIDGQTGHVWTAHDNGANTDLVHWDLDWVEVQRYTITGFNITDMGYDAFTHSFLLVDGGTAFMRWSIDDEALFPTIVTGFNLTQVQSGLDSNHEGNVYFEGSDNIHRYDTSTMTLLKSYDLGNWVGVSANQDAPTYDAFLHAVIVSDATNNPVYWIFLDRETPAGVTLEAILNDEVLLSGYEGGAADRDASDHSSTIVLGWAANARTAVVGESAAQAELYKFGHVESDHKITFPARGRATTFALVDDDLGVVTYGSEPSRKLLVTRLDQSELPVRGDIRFVDPAQDYQEGLQRAFLVPETVPGTDKESSRSFKVVLTNLEAKQREFLHLTQAYGDQQQYRFTTFHKNLRIDPGDTGTITADGLIHLVMITSTSLGANYIYEVEAVGLVVPSLSEADAILTQIHSLNTSIQAQTPDGFIPQVIESANATDLVMIDNVFLDDSVDLGNDTLVYQFTAARRSAALSWDGALIMRSDDGAEFEQFHLYQPAFEGTIGRTITALPRTDDCIAVLDTVSTVDVQFSSDIVLASVTDAELFQGKNAFMIGNELLFAATVVDNTNGAWTLSRFLRGRRGTEWAIGIQYFQNVAPDHTQWEHALYLGNQADLNKAMFRGTALTELNASKFYKAVTLGGLANAMTQEFANTGNCLRPLAPIPISGAKSGSDWAGTITRRSRIGGELRDFADVPLTDPENYEIDIYTNHLIGDTVLRTLTSTATANGSVVNSDGTWLYDQLDIEADFGESPVISPYPLYRLRVVAYQVNPETVGRGFPGTAILDDRPEPPPTDANFANVSLLLHLNSLTAMDKSSNHLQLNPGLTTGNQLTLTEGDWKDDISAFGSGILQFSDVTGSEIRISRSVMGNLFDFGSGDFTLEAWMHQQEEQVGRIIGIANGAGTIEWSWSFQTGGTDNGSLRFSWTTDGSTVQTSTPPIPSGSPLGLSHWAFTKNGTTGQMYLNGASLGSSFTISGTIFSGGGADLTIGANDAGTGSHFKGAIDSLRVTKGVARYTGATYTVPNNRFSNA